MAQLERTKVRALVDYFTRDFRSAALHTEKAIDMAREMGIGYEVMLNLHNLGDILVHLDDLPRAYGAIRQSLALCEESGYERLANYNRMFLAFLDGIQGTVDGEKLLRQGIAYAESKDFTWDVIGGRVLLANLLHRRGQLEAAREEYERTRALAVAAGHRLVVDDCDIALQKLEPTTRDARAGELRVRLFLAAARPASAASSLSYAPPKAPFEKSATVSPGVRPRRGASTMASMVGIARALSPSSRASRSRSRRSASGTFVRPERGEQDVVGGVEGARVGFLVERAARGRAARLEGDPERALRMARPQGAERLVDGRRVVREVVVDAHAARLAEQVLPPAHALERGEVRARVASGSRRSPRRTRRAPPSALRTLCGPGTRSAKRPHDMPPTKTSNVCAPSR